jgi:hypothetical protein
MIDTHVICPIQKNSTDAKINHKVIQTVVAREHADADGTSLSRYPLDTDSHHMMQKKRRMPSGTADIADDL